MVYRPDLDNWDRVLVVRYPGRRTFLKLITNPEYIKVTQMISRAVPSD